MNTQHFSYHGYRHITSSHDGTPITCRCVVRVEDGASPPYELPLRLDIWNKSPTGFEWGYGGSGPAQLSLALVAHACGDEYADAPIFQRVKEWIVSKLPHDGWTLTAEQVRNAALRAMGECGWLERVHEQAVTALVCVGLPEVDAEALVAMSDPQLCIDVGTYFAQLEGRAERDGTEWPSLDFLMQCIQNPVAAGFRDEAGNRRLPADFVKKGGAA